MFLPTVTSRMMPGQFESPTIEKSTCGRFTKNWRMLPGVALLALSIIAIAAALIWNSPWLCIPFGVGVILSGYVIHLGHQFKNLYTQSQLTELLGVHDRMYDAQIQEHRTQLNEQQGIIDTQRTALEDLQAQLATATILAERFERIKDSLSGVQGEARGQLSVLEEQVGLLKLERENLGEEQRQHLDSLIDWTEGFRAMINPETVQRQIEEQSRLIVQMGQMQEQLAATRAETEAMQQLREQAARDLAVMQARNEELAQHVHDLSAERERLQGVSADLARHSISVQASSKILEALASPKNKKDG